MQMFEIIAALGGSTISRDEVFEIGLEETAILPQQLLQLVKSTSLIGLDLSAAYFNSNFIPDALIELLINIPTKYTLKVNGSQLTEASFRYLSRFQKLEAISLQGLRFPVSEIQEMLISNRVSALKLGMVRPDGVLPYSHSYPIPDYSTILETDLKVGKLSLYGCDLELEEFLKVQSTEITKLDIGWNKITSGTIAEVGKLTSLRTLCLDFTSVSDQDIDGLRELDKLEELNLSFTSIGDQGCKLVSGLNRITTLELQKTLVSNNCVDDLGKLANLRKLDIRRTRINRTGLEHLQSLSIEELLVSLPTLDKAAAEILSKFNGLKKLHLAEVSSMSQDFFENNYNVLSSVVELRFNHPAISDHEVFLCKQFPGLRILGLAYTSITDASLSTLASLVDLTIIDLTGTNITLQSSFQRLSALKCIYLYESSVTDQGLADLCTCDSLEFIGLDGSTAITDEGISHLSNLNKMHTLEIGKTQATDKSLEVLAKCSHLHCISIQDTFVTDDGLIHFQHYTNIQSIYLSNHILTAKAGENLAKAKLLREIVIYAENTTIEQVMYLLPVSSLKELNIAHSLINDAEAMSFQEFTQIERIIIGKSKITATTIQRLKVMMPDVGFEIET